MQKRDLVRQFNKKKSAAFHVFSLHQNILKRRNETLKTYPNTFTRSSNPAGKPHANFERLLSETERQITNIQKITTTDKALLTFSYYISLQIGRTKKSDTIGENLLKPCMLAAAKEVLDLEVTYILHAIPISNGSVQRIILDMAVDVEKLLLQQVKNSKYFAIQLHYSTDLSNSLILVCFVRFYCISC